MCSPFSVSSHVRPPATWKSLSVNILKDVSDPEMHYEGGGVRRLAFLRRKKPKNALTDGWNVPTTGGSRTGMLLHCHIGCITCFKHRGGLRLVALNWQSNPGSHPTLPGNVSLGDRWPFVTMYSDGNGRMPGRKKEALPLCVRH